MSKVLADAQYGLSYSAASENATPDKFVNFNPTPALIGKPYVMVFGLNECQLCSKVTDNLKKIREYLDSNKKENVPIVVVSHLPDKDKHHLQEFAKSYRSAGVYKDGQFNKNFFLVFPESNKAAKAMEKALHLHFNKNVERSHPLEITIMDKDGKCGFSELGDVVGSEANELIERAKKFIDGLSTGKAR